MIVIDAELIAEEVKPVSSPAVAESLKTKPASSLYVTAALHAEVFIGVLLFPDGWRKETLRQPSEHIFAVNFADRILPFIEAVDWLRRPDHSHQPLS